MYALLVYFAGTAKSITIGSLLLMFLSGVASAFSADVGPGNGIPSPRFFALLSVVFLLVAILLPNKDTIYKMAGVVGQEKGIVSVDGTAVRP